MPQRRQWFSGTSLNTGATINTTSLLRVMKKLTTRKDSKCPNGFVEQYVQL